MKRKKDGEDGNVEIDMEDEGPEMTPTPTPEDGLLFSNDTHFVFYSKSSDKKPGMGAGEKIAEGDVEKYVPLTKNEKLEKSFI